MIKRGPEISGLPEHMKVREIGEKDVLIIESVIVSEALDIGGDVPVGERHCLGRLLAAAGKKDDHIILIVALMDHPGQERERHFSLYRRLQLPGRTHPGHDILEKDHSRQFGTIDFFQQGPGGDYRLEVTFVPGILGIQGRAGGVVDHHRNPAAHQETQGCQCTSGGSGDHNSDIAFLVLFELITEHQGGDKGPRVGNPLVRGIIDNGQLVAKLLGNLNELLV